MRAKYDTSYLGKSWYGHFAYNERGSPVAFCGCIPYRVKYQNFLETAGQFCDAMTLKAYRGKGIFSSLARKTEEIIAADGITFGFGLPDRNSHALLRQPGWKVTGEMTGFKIPVCAFPWAKIARLTGMEKWHQHYFSKVLTRYKTKVATFQNSLLEEEIAAVVHDADFFRYKSFKPHHFAQVAGGTAWVKAGTNLMTGDIQTKDESALSDCIADLKIISRKSGSSGILFLFATGTAHDICLRKSFKPFMSLMCAVKNFNSEIPLEKFALTFGDIDTF